MRLELIPLTDAFLPLIRSTSRDLWRYSAANDQGHRMHDGVELLELAVDDPAALVAQGIQAPTPQQVYTVVHKALASSIRVIARADDSSGIIGDACQRLIDLHPRVAAQAGVSRAKLADWVYEFHFDDEVDYFVLDPVAYAPALGDEGLRRLRGRIEALRAQLAPADPNDRFPRLDHRQFVVQWFDKRFAVLDRDVEAIVRTHLRDGRVAAWHEDVAEAMEEIGEIDLAIAWAQRASMFDRGHQSQRAAERWWRLLGEHRPLDLPAAARTILERWPSAGNGARLVAVAGDGTVDDVQTTLASRPAELVRFQLDTMRDPALAWGTAHRLALSDDGVWADLARAYLPLDPVAAIEVQLRLVATSLQVADTRRYRPAARDLVNIRRSAIAAEGTAALAVVDDAISDLRARYRRRPSLIDALDHAKLP